MDKPNKSYAECQERPMNTNFEEIFYQSPIGIFLYDKEGRLINANDSALNIARIPKLDDVLGTNIFDNPILDSKKEELQKKGLIKFQDSLDLIQIKEQNIYNPVEPKIIDIDWTVSVTDSGYLIQIQDITEHKKAEAEIVEERNILNVMIESAEGPIFSIDCNYRYTSFNSQHAKVMKTIFDVDIEIGGNLLDYHTNHKDRKNAKINIDKVFKGETVIIESFAGDSPQNRRYFSIFHTPIKDSNGKITGAAVYAKDHTEHKEAEEALKKSEAQLKEGQRLSKVGNWEWSIENDIVSWSDELYNIAGLDLERSAPNYEEHPKFYTKESYSLLDMAVKNTLKTGEPYNLLLELIRMDGEHRWIDAHGEVIKNAEGQVTGLRGTVQDIDKRKKTEESLKESEERLRLAQSLGNVGIWDWNTITDELHFTPELEQLYGLTPGTIKTYQDWRQLTHPDDIEKIEAERDEKIANHEHFDLEFRIQHKSGQKHWLSAKGGAIYNDEGDILRVLGINEDITLRKKADKKIQDLIEQLQQANEEYQESEDRFQTLADNIPNLAWMADAEGWILWYNKQWYEYTGTTLEEMQGWGWQKVHHPDYVDSITEEWTTKLKNEEPYDNTFPLKGKDGNYRWFLTRVTPIRDAQGNLIRWFGTNTDVTERINREKELEITMNELKRSNEELERFAYVSSHDLQEPLRMVTLYSQLLERRYKDSLDSDADDFIDYIVENAKRMKYLIDDLLEYSRVTSQAKEFENVDLEKVLEGVLSNLSILIVENNVTVTHDSLPTLLADKNQISQVFENLITNAIKFRGEEPPKIDISAQKGEKEWIFAMKDNGIGISPNHKEQIFEVFKRLHTREEYPGTGIGLSIVQKILERHGGRIWIESEPGKGSTFYFTIPT